MRTLMNSGIPHQQQQQEITLKRNGRIVHHPWRCCLSFTPRPKRKRRVRWFLSLLIVVTIVVILLLLPLLLLLLQGIISIQWNDTYYPDYYALLTLTTLRSYGNNDNHTLSLINTDRDSSSRRSTGSTTGHHHTVAGLSCQRYGGPTSEEAIHEMIYWYNIPSDTNHYTSLLQQQQQQQQQSPSLPPEPEPERYLTFEPDEGGWNNIRMALETTVAMAISMRRTLVLPPDMKYYLLWNEDKLNNNRKNPPRQSKGKNVMNFDDFFHLESIQQEHQSILRIITMEEFLTRVAMTGQLRSRRSPTHDVRYPNRTNWSSVMKNYESVRKDNSMSQLLWEYIRDVTQPLLWDSDKCVAVFPSSSSSSSSSTSTSKEESVMKDDGPIIDPDTQRQLDYLQQILQNDQALYGESLKQLPYQKRRFARLYQSRQDSYRNHPTEVNATAVERLAEILAHRKQLCIYNQSMHQQYLVLHMTGSETRIGSKSNKDSDGTNQQHETASTRFLIHFYAFLFYENYHTDLFIKRFIRDHFRYIDEIQCGAARIIEAIRSIARTNQETNDNIFANGQYDSFHIRRGDFQYDLMYLSAQEIYDGTTRTLIPDGRTVYIATDETDLTFFHAFQQHYNILFLHNFTHLIPDINPNYYGMIDQLVASKGEVFVGTFYSTFSGYINRLRGYHAQTNQLPGYELGLIQSYYYVPDSHTRFRNIMQTYSSVQQAFWQQEFPIAWRDINHDVTEDMIQ